MIGNGMALLRGAEGEKEGILLEIKVSENKFKLKILSHA
jgi:hypothetical protein